MKVELPEKMASTLFTPSRYKIYWGGRGGAKSVSIARALLVLGYSEKHKILCAREIQKSIQDSVHSLLKEQIEELGLQDFYETPYWAVMVLSFCLRVYGLTSQTLSLFLT